MIEQASRFARWPSGKSCTAPAIVVPIAGIAQAQPAVRGCRSSGIKRLGHGGGRARKYHPEQTQDDGGQMPTGYGARAVLGSQQPQAEGDVGRHRISPVQAGILRAEDGSRSVSPLKEKA